MGNIDEKAIAALLGKIAGIRAGLEALENEIMALGSAVTAPETDAPAQEYPQAGPAAAAPEASEPAVEETVAEEPEDETPIDISISDSDLTSGAYEMPAEEPVTVEDGDSIVSGTGEQEQEQVQVQVQEQVQEQVQPEAAEEPDCTEEPQPETVQPSEVQPQTEDDLPFGDDDLPDGPAAPAAKPEPKQKRRKAVLDSAKAETAVMDVLADKQAWRTDRPGSTVKNVISAISLNDRVLLINVLFREDPVLFQNTIAAFNAMSSLDEAVGHIHSNFPEWDLNSEPVYRLMMAVRRKLG